MKRLRCRDYQWKICNEKIKDHGAKEIKDGHYDWSI